MTTNTSSNRLRITEIFLSLQGESSTVGIPTVFIRLTGCPLRCQYCDTSYAFQGGEWMDIETIVQQVDRLQVPYVTVTGGEPLAQKACLKLLKQLCDRKYKVSLETSGAIDIADVDQRVVKVMDIKTPASEESGKNNFANIEHLLALDKIKFVICDRQDYDWAKDMLNEYKLPERCEILFSPSSGQLNPTELADWIVQDRLPVRFQLQLHKILWGDQAGR